MRLAIALALALAPALPAQEPGGTVLSRTVHRLDRLGLEVTELRLLDPEAGTIQVLAFDAAGRPVADLPALLLEEQERKVAARKGIAPELAWVLARVGPDEEVDLWLWRREAPRDFRALLEEAEGRGVPPEEARLQARDAAEAAFAPGNADLARRLAADGARVLYTGGPWPLVMARLQAGRVARWAADPAVDEAGYAFPGSLPELEYAQPTLRSTSCHRRGLDGGKATIKVMVQDPGHVATGCPYLPPVTLLNSGSPDSHATAVAGNIAMRNHAQHYGVAKALPQIFSAAGSGDTASPTAWNLAISQGVSFGNCSWWNGSKGRIVSLDRFFDYTIRQFGVMLFKSNGNQGTSSDPSATTPGNGYNMLSTGCYNDGDSADWANDAMASYSSYKNPVEGHEKPEVATPGDSVTSTYRTSSPWLGTFGGTSSASPLCCGTATLMAAADPALATKPEAVKAVLMASAWHNIEGSPVLSDKDGAGGLHTFAATEVVRQAHYRHETLTPASFAGGRLERQVPCLAGDETRVVALWFSVADSARTTDVLMMDLDLVILDPNGKTVASSASALNPFEITAFVPALTGNYTVRLIQQRFQGASERLALAWSSKRDRATNEVLLTGAGALGTAVQAAFADIYHPGQTYLGLCSVTPAPPLPLPGGFVLPFGWDALCPLSAAAFPGFFGSLGPAGTATGSISIPNDPYLKGLQAWVGMLTLDATLPNLVEETSPAASFVVK